MRRLLMPGMAAAAAIVMAGSTCAQGLAETFPIKPVMVILTFAAGGSNDNESRLEAGKMSDLMGQQFVIDFKTGGGGKLPTVVEQGIIGFSFTTWVGYSAPGATPVAIVKKLSDAYARIARALEVAAALQSDGTVMVGSTPAQFGQLISAEIERWSRIVQEKKRHQARRLGS